MKPIIPFALLGALLAVGAADAAVTDPVGYITINVAASGDTYISPSLVQPDVYAGVTSVNPSGLTVLTFASGVPTGLDSTHVLEIPSSGWWSTIVSSTATSITLNDAMPTGLPLATAISVRKHSTMLSFLGNNAPGLLTFNGVTANDEVQVLNPSTQVVTPLAYVSGPDLGDPLYPNGAWFNLSSSAVDNQFVIEPGSAVKIKRVGATALAFTTSGEVKTTKTQVDVFPNFNWVGTPLATVGTLNGLNFNSQLVQFDGVSPNYDELQFVRASQVVAPFAAILDGVTPTSTTMFDLGNSVDGGAEPFAEGTGVIIKRTGNPASTITLPGTVVAP